MFMNFQYASDLHLEFAQNKKALSKRPIQPAAEILLLAGDIMPLSSIEKHQDFLQYIADNFKMTYWLPGNHEYFGADLATYPSSFQEFIHPNLVLLNNKVITTEDPTGPIQLIFSTLWSHIPPHLTEIVAKRMRDFGEIRFKNRALSSFDYNLLHIESMSFLEKALSRTEGLALGDQKEPFSPTPRKLVISHHLPSFLNYPKKHQNDPINAGFASNLDDFILKTTPNAWIYGHHHSNLQPFLISKTQLYTNQLGYIKYKEGQGFDRKAVIMV
jgi:predicted phosphohydrolase